MNIYRHASIYICKCIYLDVFINTYVYICIFISNVDAINPSLSPESKNNSPSTLAKPHQFINPSPTHKSATAEKSTGTPNNPGGVPKNPVDFYASGSLGVGIRYGIPLNPYPLNPYSLNPYPFRNIVNKSASRLSKSTSLRGPIYLCEYLYIYTHINRYGIHSYDIFIYNIYVSICMWICIYMYIYIYTYIYILDHWGLNPGMLSE
jgi:hypothetical protein